VATTEAIDVVMPQMGVSVSEGTVTKWLKQEGEQVEADESLLEISTDKVDTEVPSPGEGVVAEIRVQEGETVEVGTVLALIRPAGGEAAPPEPTPAPAGEQELVDEPQAAQPLSARPRFVPLPAGRERRAHIDHRGVGAGGVHCLVHAVEHGDFVVEFDAAFSRRDAGHHDLRHPRGWHGLPAASPDRRTGQAGGSVRR
jgi:pyruvate/2-oxoglutarate dehydrogenase complex dihydrolipoamide acyltransferase (E2) component